MEEIVEEILKKEEEAEKIVEDAKERAQKIAREGDARASSINEEAKTKAHDAYTKKVSAAEKEAKSRYENALAEIGKEKKEEIDEVAGEIIDHLFSSNLPKER